MLIFLVSNIERTRSMPLESEIPIISIIGRIGDKIHHRPQSVTLQYISATKKCISWYLQYVILRGIWGQIPPHKNSNLCIKLKPIDLNE